MPNRSKRSPTSKKNRKKPFRLDRVVAGVGRIQRSSGTHDRRLFRQLNQMIDQLRDYGQHDILRAIRDGEWTPLEVHRLYRKGGSNPHAVRLERAADLRTSIDHWLTQRERLGTLRPSTLQMYRSCMRRITACDVFIGGSTGPLHISGALNIRTVAFYSARKSATALRWRTLNSENHRLCFSPDQYTDETDMQRIDMLHSAEIISNRYFADSDQGPN